MKKAQAKEQTVDIKPAPLRAVENVVIKAPNLRVVEISIRGNAPLVVHRFYKKASIMEGMSRGSQDKSKRNRSARDYESEFNQARHIDVTDGWDGIHAGAFRQGMISACRLIGFKMTLAKLSVFVVADGIDADGSPLIRITGTPELHTAAVRNDNGSVDVRARPMYREWSCKLRIRYDGDQFSATDVINLVSRVGLQVGIGEGRPDSKDSAGCGWGTFDVQNS